MQTFVLPGYASKNKDWAGETAAKVNGQAIDWEHWSNPNIKFNEQREAQNVLEKIGENKANFIAKSLGTLVLMKLIDSIARKNSLQNDKIGKIILCGVPINDMDENDLSFYKVLSDVKSENIIVFQNSKDEHGSFEEVRRFLSEINPQIKIVEKPGSTHDYPYFEEFGEFLAGK